MNKEKIFAWLFGLIGVALSLMAVSSKEILGLSDIQTMTFGVCCFIIVWTMYSIHLSNH